MNSFDAIIRGVGSKSSITVNKSKLAESLTDFPLLIKQINFATSDFSQSSSNLRFYDSNNNLLNHEIVNFLTGNTEIWVKTNLSSTSNTTIYYDFSGEGSVTPTNVWSNGFDFVTHLKDNGNSTFYDSVNGVYSPSASNITYYTAASDSKLGSSASINSTGPTFSPITNYNRPYTNQKMTLTYFGYSINNGLGQYIMTKNGNYNSIIFNFNANKFECFQYPRFVLNDAVWSQGFDHVGFTFDYATDSGYKFYNGSATSVSSGAVLSSTAAYGIRILAWTASERFGGYTDELRQASVVRSTGWNSFEFEMMMNHSTIFV
jgi:hypothetical protein